MARDIFLTNLSEMTSSHCCWEGLKTKGVTKFNQLTGISTICCGTSQLFYSWKNSELQKTMKNEKEYFLTNPRDASSSYCCQERWKTNGVATFIQVMGIGTVRHWQRSQAAFSWPRCWARNRYLSRSLSAGDCET